MFLRTSQISDTHTRKHKKESNCVYEQIIKKHAVED